VRLLAVSALRASLSSSEILWNAPRLADIVETPREPQRRDPNWMQRSYADLSSADRTFAASLHDWTICQRRAKI